MIILLPTLLMITNPQKMADSTLGGGSQDMPPTPPELLKKLDSRRRSRSFSAKSIR